MTDTITATKPIFSKNLAVFLIRSGFEPIVIRPDVKRLGLVVFEFYDTDDLARAMSEYSKSRNK